LGNYGGPTQTLDLLAQSPAIDAVVVNAASCTGTDQRGFARLVGARCDIGALERTDLIFAANFE